MAQEGLMVVARNLMVVAVLFYFRENGEKTSFVYFRYFYYILYFLDFYLIKKNLFFNL